MILDVPLFCRFCVAAFFVFAKQPIIFPFGFKQLLAAIGAFLVGRFVPRHKIAIGITLAAVKNSALFGFANYDFLAADRAMSVYFFNDGLGKITFGITGAG